MKLKTYDNGGNIGIDEHPEIPDSTFIYCHNVQSIKTSQNRLDNVNGKFVRTIEIITKSEYGRTQKIHLTLFSKSADNRKIRRVPKFSI